MRREILIKVTMAVVAVALLGSMIGCGKIKEMLGSKVEEQLAEGTAVPTPTEPVVAPVPTAPTPAPATEEEKIRFVNAAAQAACMAQKDPNRAMEVTNEAITKNGFDQMTYAQATAKYMVDPTIAEQINVKRSECLGLATAPTVPPTAGTAAAPAPGTAAPAPVEEKKVEEKKVEEKKVPATVGAWSGRMLGSHSGNIRFSVAGDGKEITGGNIHGTAPDPFTGTFVGSITGNEVRLIGRTGNVKTTFQGTVSGNKISGSWTGTIKNKRGEGTWSASK